jgi:hypothetical protein
MRGACLALAAAVAAAAAACGGAGGGDPLAAAQSKMGAKGTARASIDAVTKSGTEHCDMELDFDGGRLGVRCDPPAGTPAGDLEVPVEMRTIGDTMYVRSGRGSKWVKSDGGTDELSQIDPRTMLEQLQKEAREVTVVGKEGLQSVETTRYHLVDSDGAPMDVWVDGDGLVRRMRAVDGVGTADEARVDVAFFDFGADVGIEPPPADQVADNAVQFGGLFSESCSREPSPISLEDLFAAATSVMPEQAVAGPFSCDKTRITLKLDPGVQCSLGYERVAGGDAVERRQVGGKTVLAIQNVSCTVPADEPAVEARVEKLLRVAARGGIEPPADEIRQAPTQRLTTFSKPSPGG